MRKIKFRLTYHGKVVGYERHEYNEENDHITILHDEYNMAAVEDAEIQHDNKDQFTGLKDKNGKEIYEGDIVSNPIYFDGVREICFNKIGTVSTLQDGSQHSIDLLMLEHMEVIGNIHENPEMLDK